MKTKIVKTIGLIFETKKNAKETGINKLFDAYHWREKNEITQINTAIKALGFNTILIGTPFDFIQKYKQIKKRIDFIFNLSVGFISRNRLAAGPSIYEVSGLPYSGSDPYAKMVSQNKHLMKLFLENKGISTPKWVYIDKYSDLNKAKYPDFPCIVKLAYEGSSIGLDAASKVNDRGALIKIIKLMFERYKMPLIIERFIAGRELKVGFIGNEIIDFRGVIEDVKKDGSQIGSQYLHFDVKYNNNFKKVRPVLDNSISSLIIKDCEQIYRHFLPVDYGVFDIRIDETGRHYFLEFNTDATLHPERTLASCARLHGVEFKDMIKMVLLSSFKRWGLNQLAISNPNNRNLFFISMLVVSMRILALLNSLLTG